MYKDATVNHRFEFSCKTHIVSSFVWQNKLLHIYNNETASYIAIIENNAIKNIQKIGELSCMRACSYTNLNGNSQLLMFVIENEQLFGLMDIIDNKIQIHYIVNEAELQPKSISTAKADSIIANRLNLILSDLGKLQLKDVHFAEQNWGTFDIAFNHRIGVIDYWNPNKYTIDTCKQYLLLEDSMISNSIDYFVTKSNDLVRTVIFEWEEASGMQFWIEELAKEKFIAKLNFLKTFLIQKFGQPVAIKKERNTTVWKNQNGLTVELCNEINYNNIRLIIYKK